MTGELHDSALIYSTVTGMALLKYKLKKIQVKQDIGNHDGILNNKQFQYNICNTIQTLDIHVTQVG